MAIRWLRKRTLERIWVPKFPGCQWRRYVATYDLRKIALQQKRQPVGHSYIVRYTFINTLYLYSTAIHLLSCFILFFFCIHLFIIIWVNYLSILLLFVLSLLLRSLNFISTSLYFILLSVDLLLLSVLFTHCFCLRLITYVTYTLKFT